MISVNGDQALFETKLEFEFLFIAYPVFSNKFHQSFRNLTWHCGCLYIYINQKMNIQNELMEY